MSPTDTTPGPIDDLIPTDPLMAMAWVDCLRWATHHAPTIEAFRSATGTTWTPGQTPLEQMIDDATGAGDAVGRKFVEWFNENVWGGELDVVAGDNE